MTQHQANEPMEHEYDGIREYDNPTPGWWHLILWGSIVFSIAYVMIFHFSIYGSSIRGRWQNAREAYFERLFGDIGTLEGDQGTIVTMAHDEQWMVLGQSIFAGNCAQCHNADGTGGTGPNLTDDHWIHVKQVEDIFNVVTNGVAAKGMPAWDNRLGQNQRVLVAAYVSTLRGSAPTGAGKAPEPESQVIPPWPEPQADAEPPAPNIEEG